MARLNTALSVLIAVSLSAVGYGQPAPAQRSVNTSKAEQLATEGDLLQFQGDSRGAVQKYIQAETVLSEVAQSPSIKKLRADISLKNGYVQVYGPGSEDNAARKRFEDALVSFQLAIDFGTPQQTCVAQIGKAAAYVELSQPANALRMLNGVNRDALDKSQLHVLDYNFGRVHDKSGNYAEAVKSYVKSLESSPLFAPAAARVAAILPQLNQESPSTMYDSGEALIKLGYASQVENAAVGIILKDPRRPNEAALALLIRAWADGYAGPDRFPRSGKISAELMDAWCAPAIAECRVISKEPLELRIEAVNSGEHPRFPWFGKLERPENGDKQYLHAAFSDLALSTAEWFAAVDMREEGKLRLRDADQALARYLIAWGMNHRNTAAARGIAWTLKARQSPPTDAAFRKMFDTDIMERLNVDVAERVTDAVFRQKTDGIADVQEAKRNLDKAPDSQKLLAEKWESLLQFHILLGLIYEEREIWTSAQPARNALDQWQYALTAYSNIQQLTNGSKSEYAAGLHDHLAKAFANTNQKDKAYASWLQAAKSYLAVKDRENARLALTSAENLAVKPSALQQNDFEALVRAAK